MCSDSAATCGTVIRSCVAQVVDRLEQHRANRRGLTAGRRVHVLHLLDRLLPVVPEAHLARRLPHLLLAPRELFLAERDQLLRRIRDHLVRQILLEPEAAAGVARNAAVVGLSRNVRLRRHLRAREHPLARRADEEVVDLRVPGQRVEVERPERREPGLVVLRVARRRRRAASATALPPAPREALDDGDHLVLRKRHQHRKVRHLVELRRGRGRNLRRLRTRRRDEIRRRDFVPEERRVALQRRVRLLERHAHPPGEQRIVAVEMVEPVRQAGAEAVGAVGGLARDEPADAHGVGAGLPGDAGLDLRAHLRDLPDDRRHRARRLLRVDVFHPHARLVQRDHFRREREGRRQFGDRGGVGVELLQVVLDRRRERVQVALRWRRELRAIELAERGPPVEIESLQPRDAIRRERQRGRRRWRGRRRGRRTLPSAAPASAAPLAAAQEIS